MSKGEKTYRTLSEKEIRDYLRGKIRGIHAHDLERHLLNDLFDREAVSGFEQFDELDTATDIQRLKGKIRQKTSDVRTGGLKIAATISLLIIFSGVIWFVVNMNKSADRDISMFNLQETFGPNPELRTLPPEVPRENSFSGETNENTSEAASPVQEESGIYEIFPEALEEAPQVKSIKEHSLEIDPETALADTEIRLNPVRESASGVEETESAELRSLSDHSKRRSTGAVSRSALAPVERTGIVYGLVTNEYEEPLSGVTVSVKDSDIGTVTDAYGRYHLDSLPEDAVLLFAFAGYESAEVSLNYRHEVNVELETDVAALSEVAVEYDDPLVDPGYKTAVPTIGVRNYRKYLRERLVYPERARSVGIEGKVLLKLTISQFGAISDIEVRQSLGYGCDEEAIRLVKEGARWEPASRNDEPIESTVMVNVRFKLD